MSAPRSAVRLAALGATCLGALLFTFCAGRSSGRDAARVAVVDSMLAVNAHALAAARVLATSTHAAAATATVRVDTLRIATRAAERAVTIVDSAAVRVQLADSLATIPVPPVVVTELEDDRLQIHQDSLVIGAWVASDSAKAGVIAVQDKRIVLEEGAAAQERNAGIDRGRKEGAAAVALVLVLLHFILR